MGSIISSLQLSVIISTVIFISSFLAALSPKMLMKFKYFVRNIPLITAAVAGIQLASMADMIGHFNEDSGHVVHKSNIKDTHAHTKMSDHDHKSEHTKKDAKDTHVHNDKCNYSHHKNNASFCHKLSHMGPYIASGAIFLVLLAIDSIYLHGKGHVHKNSKKSAGHKHSHISSKEDHNHHVHGECTHENIVIDHLDDIDNAEETSKKIITSVTEKENHCGQFGSCNTSAISTSKTKATALISLFAISFHSIFEGLAINTQNLSFTLFFGLLLHKILESFSVGSSVLDSVFSFRSKIILIFIYSMLTPIFIFFRGLPLLSDNKILSHYFNGLCIGSLFFVIFYECIGHIFHNGKDAIRKNISITGGYVLGCIAVVLGHDHH